LHQITAEGEVSPEKQKVTNFRVKGQGPLEATAALYANFLAISRVATDVQFEFVFLDLNQVAVLLEQIKNSENPTIPELEGKTVAKLVMPAATVLQLKEHFQRICDAIEENIGKQPEVQNGRSSKAAL
jgi:hypothetical protein